MGKIICVGLGPGDPDLMSVKAERLIKNAAQIAYFSKKNSKGQARKIVEHLLPVDVEEWQMVYPLTTEISFHSDEYKTALADFYDEWAEKLISLGTEKDMIVLCEGDPFFYGSYMHLYIRLQGKIEQEIIPAITGMSGCWTATQIPMTWGDDVLSVLMGTLEEEILLRHVIDADAIAIMKTGHHLPKICRVLKAADKYDAAWLVIKGTMAEEQVIKLSEYQEEICPYFSIILVHGQGRRP